MFFKLNWWQKIKAIVKISALSYFLIYLLLVLQRQLFPQTEGFLAFSQVIAPYLGLPMVFLLLISPLTIKGMSNRGLLILAGVICLAAWGLEFCQPSITLPPEQASKNSVNETKPGEFEVMTWNIYLGNDQLDQAVAYLINSPVKIIALQEPANLWEKYKPALTAAYPYFLSYPYTNKPYLVILSKYPVLMASPIQGYKAAQSGSAILWATLNLGNGRTITVATFHPSTPENDHCPLALCYETSKRDNQLKVILLQLKELSQTHPDLLVMGDFNLTDREPIYKEFTRYDARFPSFQLTDALTILGENSFNTWRPARFKNLPLALFRIDYLFFSKAFAPISIKVDCTPLGSDHCLVEGRFALL